MDSARPDDAHPPIEPGPMPTSEPPALGDSAGMRMLLPVGRSPWAIAAGYAGLLSPLVIPAPFALVLGVIAIIDIRRHPHRRGMVRALVGLIGGAAFTTLLIISIVIAARR